MSRSLLITTTFLCCYITQVWAANGEDNTAVKPALEQRVVCKREKVTGSHFKKRVCRTQAEIDEAKKDAKRFVDESRRYQEAVRNSAAQSQ